jgi:MtN3 and saliva related transmembrane protein
MEFTTIVGLLASIATGTSLIPQLVKIVKDKKAGAISLGMLAVLFVGLAGWVYYGFLKMDWIIIISNIFSLIVNILIVIFSVKYKQAPGKS